MSMTDTRPNSLVFRVGRRKISLPRSISYSGALQVLRQQLNIGDEHDLHFLQPSLHGGISGPTPIEESCWEGVARVAGSIQVNLSRPLDRSHDHETSSDGSQASPITSLTNTSSGTRLRAWAGHGVTSIAQPGSSGSSFVRQPNPSPSRSLTVAASPVETSLPSTNSQRSRSADMIIASARSSSPESVESRPPPYTRVAEGETNRKITFTIVNEDNEVVTLSAKRSSKALRILETACDVFKLDSSKCRLQHAGRVYGHGDIERLTLSSLDIENGDRLGISWDCTTIQSEMRLYPTEPSHTASLYNEGKVRISVTLAPQWRFDDLGPEAPVDKATGSSKIIWHADLRPDGSLAIPNLPGRFDRLSWESRSKPVITSERHLSEDSIPGNANRPLNVAVEDPSLQVNKHSPLRKHLGPDMWSSLLLHVICVIVLSPMVVILDILSFLGLRRKRKGKKVDMDDQIRPTTQILNLLDPSKCLRDENSVLLRGTDVRRHLEGVLETTGVPRTVWDAFVGRICPSIARNQYVLMRLISTEDYRQMSTIRVSPEPDTLVRLLLVYAGVPSTNLGEWPGAARRGQASFSDQTEIFCKSVPMAKGGAGFTAVELSCVQLYLDEE